MNAFTRFMAPAFICATIIGGAAVPDASARDSVAEQRQHAALARLPLGELHGHAKRGSAHAQFVLGEHYDARQKRAHAAYWYRKAAVQGHAGGQLGLGILYEFGTGVPQSHMQAYVWYSLAIARGIKGYDWWRDEMADKLRAEELAQAQMHTVLLHVLISRK